jgi:glyoxylase-like metal-dependent hydrolase (beta-lactamase superfamily II)
MILRDIEFEPSEAAPAQLRRRGVDPRAVRLVLMTHMHLDHASAVSEFADATFVVAEAEWRAATASLGVLRGYVASQFDHAVEVRLLDFEAAEVDSLSGFGRALDLFGDGSVHAVYTPGHTVGHVSYVVRTAGSEVLVAGDAIYAMRTLRESVMPWRVEDAHNFRRSLREIQLYARETPGAVIVPGHDLERWNELEPVY